VPDQRFLASLFDVSFSSLITTKVIKVIYVLSMVLIGLGALFFVVVAFTKSVVGGLITLLILAPFFALLYLIYVRVLLEIVIAIFRIMETNVELVALQRTAGAGGGAGPATGPTTTMPPPGPSAPPPPMGLS
jgi:Domain of unknown function (DUF4282)